MTTLLLGAVAKFAPYIVGLFIIAFGALKLRQSGANSEKAKQAKAEAKARSVADEVDSDIGMLPPELARKELSKWSKP